MFHDAIYKQRLEIMANLHGHCRAITKNALKAGILSTHKFVESGTNKIVESVLEVFDQHYFIEIKDHGFLSLSKTIDEAGEQALKMMQVASNV